MAVSKNIFDNMFDEFLQAKGQEMKEKEPDFVEETEYTFDMTHQTAFSTIFKFHPSKGIEGCPDFPVIIGPNPQEQHFYVYNKKDLVTLALAMFSRHSTFITGPTGCGKTDLVNYIGKRLGLAVTRVSCHPLMERTEVIGQIGLESDENGNPITKFKPGVIPNAIQGPGILLIDEADRMPRECAMPLQGLYESNTRAISIPETSETIQAHKDCVIVLTGNTKGFGDGLDRYGSAQIADQATINRMNVHMTMSYLPAKVEESLVKEWQPSMSDDLINKLVKFGNKVREAWNKDTLSIPFSPRTLQNIAHYAVIFKNPVLAIEMCYARALPEEDQLKTVGNLCHLIFGKEYGTIS